MSTRNLIISTLMISFAITFCYLYVDALLAQYFYSLKNTPLAIFASVLTYFGEGVYYIVPSLFLFLFYRNRNSYYAQISLFIFATTSISGVIANLIKPIFGRFRPERLFNENFYGFNWFEVSYTMNSFPSGHSTTALGAWFAFSLIFPKYRTILILIGISIALTRIIVTAHYLSDVIAGGVLGITITLLYYHRIYLKQVYVK